MFMSAGIKRALEKGRKKKRILFADDELHVREIMEELLTNFNYEVVAVDSGIALLNEFRNNIKGFDLLILDVIMPEMSGRDALTKARKLNPDIPAILISGYTSEEMASEILDIPNVKFLRKPFKIENMRKAIKQMTGG